MASLKDCPVLLNLIHAAFCQADEDLLLYKFKCIKEKFKDYYFEWRHMILDLIVELDMIPRKEGTEVYYASPKHSWMIIIYNECLNIQLNIIKNGLVIMFRRDDKSVSWHDSLRSSFFVYGYGESNDELWGKVTKGNMDFNQNLVLAMDRKFKKTLIF